MSAKLYPAENWYAIFREVPDNGSEAIIQAPLMGWLLLDFVEDGKPAARILGMCVVGGKLVQADTAPGFVGFEKLQPWDSRSQLRMASPGSS